MQEKRKALGKGLEQLFSDENINTFEDIENDIVDNARANNSIVELNLDELRPNPYQPRKKFDEEALNELAASIKEHGVFQPIIVKKTIKGYDIVAGERRFRASKKAGLTTIPAIIEEFSDEEMMQISLLENLQREDLTAIEEAKAYKAIIEASNITQDELARRVGKSRSHITNMLGLLKLPTNVQDLVLYNKISMGHARVLSKLEDIDKINELAEMTMRQDLSVRELEEISSNSDIKRVSPVVRKPKDGKYDVLERKLKEKFGTKVKISDKKITISFENVQDLNRILEIMNFDIDE
ncbi:MAG: ParB/RepB/Spo0J family partition protein [Bacilli bacterium]|nr:ParB/RepB/Spo0J family partition protein [Bacilli bacterium]